MKSRVSKARLSSRVTSTKTTVNEITDDEATETTGDSGDEGENRPKPEFEGQAILAGDSEAQDEGESNNE
mgnify:CR=1 FL=1